MSGPEVDPGQKATGNDDESLTGEDIAKLTKCLFIGQLISLDDYVTTVRFIESWAGSPIA
jgi:hypothetical protein